MVPERESNPEPDDAVRLVQSAAKGDAKAFEQLVLQYSRFAAAVAYGVTGDYHGTRDVVQDGFLKVHASLGTLQSADRFRPWLRNVMRTTALDWRRRNKRGMRSLELVGDGESDPEAPNKDESLDDLEDAGEIRARVREEIEKLPETHREVVALKYLDGKTYEEIEALTGLTQNTIESRLFRARQKLKSRFEHVLKKTKHPTSMRDQTRE